MPTTVTKFCGTAVDNADGFDAWSTASNAQGSTDAVYATSGGSSCDAAGGVGNYIKCTNFGLTSSDVPAGASINGITVSVVAHGTRTSANFGHIFLVKGSTIMTATTDKGGAGQPGSTTDVSLPPEAIRFDLPVEIAVPRVFFPMEMRVRPSDLRDYLRAVIDDAQSQPPQHDN